LHSSSPITLYGVLMREWSGDNSLYRIEYFCARKANAVYLYSLYTQTT